MGRRRTFKCGPDAEALARFLLDLGERRGLEKVEDFTARFPSVKKTVWAEYLNGSSLIEKAELAKVVQSLCGTDRQLLAARTLRANQLWNAAAAELRDTKTSLAHHDEKQLAARETAALHERLTDTTERLMRAKEHAENARGIITVLGAMAGILHAKVAEISRERDNARERERAEAGERLARARLRLERTEHELALAQQNRLTAEQAQQVLIREAHEARQELERLRRQSAYLGDNDEALPDENAALSVREEASFGDEESDFDDALDKITADRQDHEQDLADLAAHTGLAPPSAHDKDHQVLQGTLLSRTDTPTLQISAQLSASTADNPSTRHNHPGESPHAALWPYFPRPGTALADYQIPDFLDDLHDLLLQALRTGRADEVGALLPAPRTSADLAAYRPEDFHDDLHGLLDHAKSREDTNDTLLLPEPDPAAPDHERAAALPTQEATRRFLDSCNATAMAPWWEQCREAARNNYLAQTPAPLSADNPDNAPTSQNTPDLAVDKIPEAKGSPEEKEFWAELKNLLRTHQTTWTELLALAPTEHQANSFTRARLPSRQCLTAVITHLDPTSLPIWHRRLDDAATARKARKEAKANTNPDRWAGKPLPPRPPDTAAQRFWAKVCCLLLIPVLGYTATAILTAGIQALPETSVVPLIIYFVVAVPATAFLAFLLSIPALELRDDDSTSVTGALLGILGLLAGLGIPWIGPPDTPWQWIADHLGIF
ncbi:hypothetical protein [Streptomyces sp. NPDC051561]|uniref:hypothetical protein n=1 Tax=Streptomyces sp. NPDC051561 TaxID=3365658 RepID=UPI00378C9DDD